MGFWGFGEQYVVDAFVCVARRGSGCDHRRHVRGHLRCVGGARALSVRQ